MAHRKGHFDSTTFRRMNEKFNEEQLKSSNADIVGGELNLPTFSFRGKDAYRKRIGNAQDVRAPYVKNQGTNKKFPYLSSKHHVGTIFNPMATTIRNKEAMTVAEERKATQDRMLDGSFVEDMQGTRGSSYFGPEFDRRSEKQARIAVERDEYLRDIALNEGEEGLFNALNTLRQGPNKNGVMINLGSEVEELFPMDNAKSKTNLQGGYSANPAGQSFRNINNFRDLSNTAIAAQDKADYYREYFGSRVNRPLVSNYFDTRGGE